MTLSESEEVRDLSLADTKSFANSLAERFNRLISKVDENILFCLAFTFYFIATAMCRTAFNEAYPDLIDLLDTILKIAVALLLAVKFLLQRVSLSGWIMAILLGSVGLLSWRISAEGWLFWCCLFILCSKNVDIKQMAKLTFCLSVAVSLFAAISVGLGLVDNIALVRGNETRYCLGFSHPNSLGLYLLIACFSLSVLRFGKNPAPDIAFIVATDVLNLTVANSRTCVLLSLVQIVLLVIFYWVHNEFARRSFRICFIIVVLFVIAASIYFMVAYDPSNSLQAALDSALSTRLSLAHSYYDMQPLTVFGCSFEQFEPICWDGGKPCTFLVDNAWCHLYLRYGIVSFLLFLIGYLSVFLKAMSEKRWDALLFGFVLMTIYGFCETQGIRIECNFLLCAIGTEILYAKETKRYLYSLIKPLHSDR